MDTSDELSAPRQLNEWEEYPIELDEILGEYTAITETSFFDEFEWGAPPANQENWEVYESASEFESRRANKNWQSYVELCAAYMKEFRVVPAYDTTYCGKRIGIWYKNQKAAYENGKLSLPQCVALMKARIRIIPLWGETLILYALYKAETCLEPNSTTVYQGRPIGSWSLRQQHRYASGCLSESQIIRLRQYGFPFEGSTATKCDNWITLYADYKSEYGREPTSTTVYRRYKLGEWCKIQRNKHQRGELTEAYYNALYALGFPFDAPCSKWDEWFNLYCEYKEEYGKEPTWNTIYHNQKLGSWCGSQAYDIRGDKISAKRKQKLQEANFAFGKHHYHWDDLLALYCVYKEIYRKEPTDDVIFRRKRLGTWCREQKKQYSNNTLPQEHLQKLIKAKFKFV